jgi:hypothetical protein
VVTEHTTGNHDRLVSLCAVYAGHKRSLSPSLYFLLRFSRLLLLRHARILIPNLFLYDVQRLGTWYTLHLLRHTLASIQLHIFGTMARISDRFQHCGGVGNTKLRLVHFIWCVRFRDGGAAFRSRCIHQ